jgi:hypothetical protein
MKALIAALASTSFAVVAAASGAETAGVAKPAPPSVAEPETVFATIVPRPPSQQRYALMPCAETSADAVARSNAAGNSIACVGPN